MEQLTKELGKEEGKKDKLKISQTTTSINELNEDSYTLYFINS